MWPAVCGRMPIKGRDRVLHFPGNQALYGNHRHVSRWPLKNPLFAILRYLRKQAQNHLSCQAIVQLSMYSGINFHLINELNDWLIELITHLSPISTQILPSSGIDIFVSLLSSFGTSSRNSFKQRALRNLSPEMRRTGLDFSIGNWSFSSHSWFNIGHSGNVTFGIMLNGWQNWIIWPPTCEFWPNVGWKIWRMEKAVYGKWRVWKKRSVEDTDCGEGGVFIFGRQTLK